MHQFSEARHFQCIYWYSTQNGTTIFFCTLGSFFAETRMPEQSRLFSSQEGHVTEQNGTILWLHHILRRN